VPRQWKEWTQSPVRALREIIGILPVGRSWRAHDFVAAIRKNKTILHACGMMGKNPTLLIRVLQDKATIRS
jgi:hypothetical protein